MNSAYTGIEPDPFLWERIQEGLSQRGLDSDGEYIQHLHRLALGSNYAATQLGKYPEFLSSLEQCRDWSLDESTLASALQDESDENLIKRELRLFRHRKLVEILYLDLCLNSSVEDTLQRLSDLADLLIRQALARAESILCAKHGQPVDQLGETMQLNIIGMGKLGGGELNFSSDIDLICVYSEEGRLKGFGQMEYSQYFMHVTRLFKKFLHDNTADGFVYRVDLRLRPWGDSGPLVLSHEAFEHYYQLHGREWEQYAMVKARVITGTDSDKKYLQSVLKPFVYRRYHDYRVFDGLAQLKKKIDQQAERKHERNNIKTGRGGIREIEFYIQAFQILKGGRNHHLQTPSLFSAFEVLSEQQITDQAELENMLDAYRFLRRLENHIQMLDDHQTHDVPANEDQRQRIAVLMGHPDWNALEAVLTQHQQRVNEIFSTLFVAEEQGANDKHPDIHFNELDEDRHLELIRQLGYHDAEAIHRQLQNFYASKAFMFMSEKAKRRFHAFFPDLLNQVSRYDDQGELLSRMLGLLSSIAGRSVYFELLYQNILMLVKVVELFQRSAWIASEVTRYPLLLESILYPEHLDDRFDRRAMAHSLDVQLGNIRGDVEMELDTLRQFKRAQTIEIASAQISAEINTEQVSHYLSELAAVLLEAVYQLAYRETVANHGEPHCEIDGEALTPGFAILAYGKLGGRELHYQSDLDIIFIHNSNGDRQYTDGKRSIDNTTFFARLAQKIISKITLLTPAGKLYEIDTRLRPDGASGMMVSPLHHFRHYQLNNAWVWEHQAIIRARFIAGNPALSEEFESIRKQVMQLSRDDDHLRREVVSMRARMHQTKNPPEGERMNIKHSHGGMVDIEFMVQYWVLRHANKFASLCQSTDNNTLIGELIELGLITREDAQLAQIYQTYHQRLQALVLQNQPAELPSDAVSDEINFVTGRWQRVFANVTPAEN